MEDQNRPADLSNTKRAPIGGMLCYLKHERVISVAFDEFVGVFLEIRCYFPGVALNTKKYKGFPVHAFNNIRFLT